MKVFSFLGELSL